MTNEEINKEIKHTVDVKDVFGKKVLTKNGADVGRVDTVYLNTQRLDVDSVKVKKGFFSTDHIIGKVYLSTLSKEGAVLNIAPIEEFIGMQVHDAEGKLLGVVKSVDRVKLTDKLSAIEVDRGEGKANVSIPIDKIKEVGESIVLNAPEILVLPLKKKD